MEFRSSVVRPMGRRLLGAILAAGLLLAPLALPAAAEDAKAPKAEEKPAAIKRVPILWEVQTKPKIYLFGTIHVADPRVLKHPPVVQKALDNSQALYTELDFRQLAGPEMAKHIMIPGGKDLAAISSKELIAKLDKVAKRYELNALQVMQFKRIKPWLSAVQIPMTVNAKRNAEKAAKEAAKAGTDAAAEAKPAAPEQALDLKLFLNALQGGKHVGGLEKPIEQFSIFNEITMEKQLKMLEESLDAVLKLDEPGEGDGEGEAAVDQIEQLIEMYLRGNVDTFYTFMQESMGKDPEMKGFMAKLLDKRNITMVRRMMEAAEKHPDKTMFVAVGSGHYPGELGILKLLERTGFRVRPLHSLADMEKPWPKAGAQETSSRAAPRRRRIRIGPFCLPGPCCPR